GELPIRHGRPPRGQCSAKGETLTPVPSPTRTPATRERGATTQRPDTGEPPEKVPPLPGGCECVWERGLGGEGLTRTAATARGRRGWRASPGRGRRTGRPEAALRPPRRASQGPRPRARRAGPPPPVTRRAPPARRSRSPRGPAAGSRGGPSRG